MYHGRKGGNYGGKNRWQMGSGKKVSKGKRKVAREKGELARRVEKQGTLQRGVEKDATRICMPLMKDSDHVEEANDSKEDLQAWCLLE